ncbi:unnamed protein product, partial [Symbiodinium sp. CCMP2592]
MEIEVYGALNSLAEQSLRGRSMAMRLGMLMLGLLLAKSSHECQVLKDRGKGPSILRGLETWQYPQNTIVKYCRRSADLL